MKAKIAIVGCVKPSPITTTTSRLRMARSYVSFMAPITRRCIAMNRSLIPVTEHPRWYQKKRLEVYLSRCSGIGDEFTYSQHGLEIVL